MEEALAAKVEKEPKKKGCGRKLLLIVIVMAVVGIAGTLFFGEEIARYGYNWRKDTILERLPQGLDRETFKKTLTEFGEALFARTVDREDVKAWVGEVKHAFRDDEFLNIG